MANGLYASRKNSLKFVLHDLRHPRLWIQTPASGVSQMSANSNVVWILRINHLESEIYEAFPG